MFIRVRSLICAVKEKEQEVQRLQRQCEELRPMTVDPGVRLREALGEIETLQQRVATLEAQKEELEAKRDTKIRDTMQQIADKLADENNNSQEKSDSTIDVGELQKQLQQAIKNERSHKERMERARKDRDETTKKCGELKRQVEQATREKEAADKLVRDLRAQTVKLRESIREQSSHAVREQVQKDGVDRLTAEKSELVEQLEQRDRAIESERRIHLAATLEHRQAMDQLRQQLEEAADKLTELKQRKTVRLSTHDVIRIKAICLLYTSPSPRDRTRSRMPSSA